MFKIKTFLCMAGGFLLLTCFLPANTNVLCILAGSDYLQRTGGIIFVRQKVQELEAENEVRRVLNNSN